MDLKEKTVKILQDIVLPDLAKIREENAKISTNLELTNKRLDDINTHLADQSRRIDGVRAELGEKIDATNERIDDTNNRIDGVRAELSDKIDATNNRIDGLRAEVRSEISKVYNRMQDIHSDLILRLDKQNARIDEFIATCARESDVVRLETRVQILEGEVKGMKERLAA